MEEAEESRYWCHMCSQVVNPVMEIETIKCPFCQSGFVEEMASATVPGNDFGVGGSDSDRALSLWAPFLLGMMSNPRRRQFRHLEFEDDVVDDDDDRDDNDNSHQHHDGETEFDQLESVIRRRRRRRRDSATILQLLQGIRAGMLSEIDQQNRDTDNDRDGERMLLINPFNQTIIVRGAYDPVNDSQNRAPIGSLGDYFVGPGLDLLLQHLADNDPNMYGTPPAKKEAVEALATVKNEEAVQCSVCLDECEIGAEVKEMPCKHKFHNGCILPWLELHSSCPVCRYQLPCDESKLDSDEDGNNGNQEGDERNESGRRFSVPLPWPFNNFFSSQSSSGNSSLPPPSS